MASLISCTIKNAPGFTLLSNVSVRKTGSSRSTDGGVVARTLEAIGGPPFVVVDFTAREQTAAILTEAHSVPCGIVIGTSGLDEQDRRLLTSLSRDHAIVVDANFSAGFLPMKRFVADLAVSTGEKWNLGVTDMHFVEKRDAPSATAIRLARTWTMSRGNDPGSMVTMCSLRMGDSVSEHIVLSAGPGERLEIRHQVLNRTAFLPGILSAITFVHSATPGMYSLEAVLSETGKGS